jgi:hypothetical protein
MRTPLTTGMNVEVITWKVVWLIPWPGKTLRNICVINEDGYVTFVVITIRSPPHSYFWGYNKLVTWVHPGCYLSNLISISDGVRVAYQLDKFSTPNGVVIEIHNSKKDIQYNGKRNKKKKIIHAKTKNNKRYTFYFVYYKYLTCNHKEQSTVLFNKSIKIYCTTKIIIFNKNNCYWRIHSENTSWCNICPLEYVSNLNTSRKKCTYLSFVLYVFHDIFIQLDLSIKIYCTTKIIIFNKN